MKLINYIKYFFHYILKPLLYIHHYSSQKINFDWENTNSDRIEVINKIIKKKRLSKYLEIGCDQNKVFNAIRCQHKIGVDPKSGGTIRETSDIFFLKNNKKFDIIFIDGLHTFDQIIKDFNNSFKCLNMNGYIIIHDLLPRTYLEEHVPRISNNWCGDIWKISFLLKKIKKHEFKILKTDFGIGIFKKKKKTINIQINNVKSKNFKYYISNLKFLPIIEKKEFFDKVF